MSALLDRWAGVRQTGPNTWRGPCVVCGTKALKVSVRELDDGRTLIHAFCGHDVVEIVEALGLTMSDLFPPRLDQHRYPPSRSRIPAGEALACVDHEVLVAYLILGDVLKEKKADASQWQRLVMCATRIAQARNLSCPARVPKESARAS